MLSSGLPDAKRLQKAEEHPRAQRWMQRLHPGDGKAVSLPGVKHGYLG